MATLYEINQAILDTIDLETGEIIDVVRLNELEMAKAEKIENVVLWIKNLDAETDAIIAEMEALMKRRRVKENKAYQLRQYLSEALEGQRFETARCAVGYRKSQAVEIEDEKAFLDWIYSSGRDDLLTYQQPKVNKTEVKAALKTGLEIPGAALVEKHNMQIK